LPLAPPYAGGIFLGLAVSIWGTIFGTGVAAPIEAIGNVIDDLHTSKEEKDAAKIVMERLRQQPAKLQAAINAIEAQHRSMFVAGGRPFIIWVCGWTLAYIWILRIVFSDIMVAFGGQALPELDVSASDVVLLLGPILGLGTLRTGEKLAGRAK